MPKYAAGVVLIALHEGYTRADAEEVVMHRGIIRRDFMSRMYEVTVPCEYEDSLVDIFRKDPRVIYVTRIP